MKKILAAALIVLITATVFSQELRLNVYSGYVFNEGFDATINNTNYFKGTLTGGYQWGAGVEYLFYENFSSELLYLHQSTHAPTTYETDATGGTKSENFDVNLNYILVSADGRGSNQNGKLEGYGGVLLGVMINNVKAPSTDESTSHTDFAWGARVGGNIWVSHRVAVKLQAQLLSASRATGGELYFGNVGAITLSTYTNIYQFTLGGGLTFRLFKDD